MIMKANKQIGFIYKNEESINKILKDGDVVFEKGFLRERTSTTLPITFDGIGKNLKDYKIYGNTKQEILPSGYTQVDYIESTGTQYIDTNYYGNLNTEIKAKAITTISTNRQLFGDITDNSKGISCNISISSNQTSRFGSKSVSLNFQNYISLNTIFDITENKNGIYVNGTQVATFNETTSFNTEKTLFLLNRNGSIVSTTNAWIGKLYFCKIYDNGVLVRDFIPCYRNSDNVIGLYDLVNDVFYTNQGSGAFTCGSIAPTPDTPLEMISCGNKTKNLFDISQQYTSENLSTSGITLTFNNDGTITVNGTNASSYKYIRYDIELEAGTYYFSGCYTGGSKNGYSSLIELTSGTSNQIFDYGEGNSFTLSEKTTIKYYPVRIGSDTVTFENMLFKPTISKVQVSYSEYEPFGYKIPINVKSDNLFNKNNANILNAYFSSDAKTITSSQNAKVLFVSCKSNTTYTITKVVSKRFRILTTETLPAVNTVGIDVYDDATASLITITTSSNVNYLCVYYYYNGVDTLTEQQILNSIVIKEGSIAPSKYIPYYNETTNIYLKEPLRKIGDYSDYIDFGNSKVIRNIDEIILNGSEDWADSVIASDVLTHRFRMLGEKSHVPEIGLCRSFIVKDSETSIRDDVEMIQLSSTSSNKYIGVKIYISRLSTDDTSGLTSWLSSNNIILDYVLTTPEQETIILPNISTIDGDNTLNIETEITPSQVYIKYKSNV